MVVLLHLQEVVYSEDSNKHHNFNLAVVSLGNLLRLIMQAEDFLAWLTITLTQQVVCLVELLTVEADYLVVDSTWVTTMEVYLVG